jgi:hypothetical protein
VQARLEGGIIERLRNDVGELVPGTAKRFGFSLDVAQVKRQGQHLGNVSHETKKS